MSTEVKNKKENGLQASNCSKIRFEGIADDKCKNNKSDIVRPYF